MGRIWGREIDRLRESGEIDGYVMYCRDADEYQCYLQSRASGLWYKSGWCRTPLVAVKKALGAKRRLKVNLTHQEDEALRTLLKGTDPDFYWKDDELQLRFSRSGDDIFVWMWNKDSDESYGGKTKLRRAFLEGLRLWIDETLDRL